MPLKQKRTFLCRVQFLNTHHLQISALLEHAPYLRREKSNERHGAYLSKYGISQYL